MATVVFCIWPAKHSPLFTDDVHQLGRSRDVVKWTEILNVDVFGYYRPVKNALFRVAAPLATKLVAWHWIGVIAYLAATAGVFRIATIRLGPGRGLRPASGRRAPGAYFRYWAGVWGNPVELMLLTAEGLPLDHARNTPPAPAAMREIECPLQQGLADANPDVDAVYRMLFPLPVALRDGAWCPFNSQNTTFFRKIFPLLYLPAPCSFRHLKKLG